MSPKRTEVEAVTNIGASVRARLLNIARKSDRDYNRILVQYAQERLLYRLSISRYRENFVLKGALLFLIYDMPHHRPTKDIDLLGEAIDSDVAVMREMVKEVTAIMVNDGVMFDPATIVVRRIAEQAEYGGTRISLHSFVGDARIVLQIDVGFGDKIVEGPLEVEYPVLLDYPAPHIKVYSLESAIAEKFEAIVRLNVVTSRMKDFYDIVYLAQHHIFKSGVLAEAVEVTFENRGTPLADRRIIWSDEFKNDDQREKQWNAFHTTNKLSKVGSIADIVEMLKAFLEPILVDHEQYSQWQPDRFCWQEREIEKSAESYRPVTRKEIREKK